ncbi:MAG: PLP-dependent cysteine synthase family protein [Candidatus Bathyarchaeia archaeon]
MATFAAKATSSRPVEEVPIPVGNTPLLPLTIHPRRMKLFAKLEWYPQNRFDLFSSVKDRPAYYMLKGAERRGELTPRQKIVVEPTSGNTGIALARMGKALGYDVTVVVPNRSSEETRSILRSLGVGVTETWDDLCPKVGSGTDQSIAVARALVQSNPKRKRDGLKEYYMPNQYENEDNFQAHYQGTGPEIWRQTAGQVTHVFVGVGTGGSISGIETYLKQRNPKVKVYAVEPEKGHNIQGLRNFEESAVPQLLARHVNVDDKKTKGEWIRVSDEEAFEAVRRLGLKENLLVGSSSGAVLHAALRTGEVEEGVGVLIFADSGDKYQTLFQQQNIFTEEEIAKCKSKQPLRY